MDKEGNVVPRGVEGEMCVRGYLNMLGYWEDPEKTKETIDSARWLKTVSSFVEFGINELNDKTMVDYVGRSNCVIAEWTCTCCG